MTSNPPASKATCRICRGDAVREIGSVEFYEGYDWPISDCASCGCRFTRHDASFYDKLHNAPDSSYQRYRRLLGECRDFFRRGDRAGLKEHLSRVSKYRFITDAIDELPPGSAVLEVGCSRGYLASYAILAGHSVLAVDISSDAIGTAREAFGDHFALMDESVIRKKGPFDLIYHTGTIGCVADPLGLTRMLLSNLKPDGKLVFNAPNLDSCRQKDQLWLSAAPPPDVVTLFPPSFWMDQCHEQASVSVKSEALGTAQAFPMWLRNRLGWHWHKPVPIPLTKSSAYFESLPDSRTGLRRALERSISKAAQITGLARLAPPQPDDFGLFVSMTLK